MSAQAPIERACERDCEPAGGVQKTDLPCEVLEKDVPCKSNEDPQYEVKNKDGSQDDEVQKAQETDESEALEESDAVRAAQHTAALCSRSFKKMMNSEGPVVKAVLLKSNGDIVELDWDSTVKKDHISEILGGPPTILGEFPGVPVIFTQKKDTAEDDELNKHVLPSPYEKLKIYGDIFCIRMDETAEPEPFTKADYLQYRKDLEEGKIEVSLSDTEDEEEFEHLEPNEEEILALAEIIAKELGVSTMKDVPTTEVDAVGTASAVALNGAEDDEEEEEEEDDEDIDDEERTKEEQEEEILELAVDAYRKITNQDPTEEQLAEIIERMGFNVIEGEEEPAEITKEDEEAMLVAYFEEFWGRPPTTEEVQKLMLKLPEFKAAVNDESDEEDYVPTHEELVAAAQDD